MVYSVARMQTVENKGECRKDYENHLILTVRQKLLVNESSTGQKRYMWLHYNCLELRSTEFNRTNFKLNGVWNSTQLYFELATMCRYLLGYRQK